MLEQDKLSSTEHKLSWLDSYTYGERGNMPIIASNPSTQMEKTSSVPDLFPGTISNNVASKDISIRGIISSIIMASPEDILPRRNREF